VDRPIEPGEEAFRERVIEATETSEEVIVRKEAEERTETVRDRCAAPKWRSRMRRGAPNRQARARRNATTAPDPLRHRRVRDYPPFFGVRLTAFSLRLAVCSRYASLSGIPRLLLSWLHRPFPLLDFRVERRPKQHGCAGDPGPDHEAEDSAERTIEPAIVGYVSKVPGDRD
jgi:hypothetical protein